MNRRYEPNESPGPLDLGQGQTGQTPWEPAAAIFAGGLLVGVSLSRGRLLGTLLTLAAGGLIGCAAARRMAQPHSRAADRRDGARAEPGESVRDVVDEASWESFPASDPPGY